MMDDDSVDGPRHSVISRYAMYSWHSLINNNFIHLVLRVFSCPFPSPHSSSGILLLLWEKKKMNSINVGEMAKSRQHQIHLPPCNSAVLKGDMIDNARFYRSFPRFFVLAIALVIGCVQVGLMVMANDASTLRDHADNSSNHRHTSSEYHNTNNDVHNNIGYESTSRDLSVNAIQKGRVIGGYQQSKLYQLLEKIETFHPFEDGHDDLLNDNSDVFSVSDDVYADNASSRVNQQRQKRSSTRFLDFGGFNLNDMSERALVISGNSRGDMDTDVVDVSSSSLFSTVPINVVINSPLSPSVNSHFAFTETSAISQSNKYNIRYRFAKGRHGEIWRAIEFIIPASSLQDFVHTSQRSSNETNFHSSNGSATHPSDTTAGSNTDNNSHSNSQHTYILKRIFSENGIQIIMTGRREIYFGRYLRGVDRVAKFIESFYHNSDLWLIFVDEGKSLENYLYTKLEQDKNSVIYDHSEFWRQMKLDPSGPSIIKEVIKQLLEAVSIIHRLGVVHRDLKPANVIISHDTPPKVKLIDFGSAVDVTSPHRLYLETGPSKDEETLLYAPPEVLFSTLPFHADDPTTYDIWSIGVIALELILGTSHVWQLDPRSQAILLHQLGSAEDHVKDAALIFRAMRDYCIYKDSHSTCNEYTLQHRLRMFDRVGVGFNDIVGLKLIMKLLSWDPKARPSAERALQHAYFSNNNKLYHCSKCRKEYEYKNELLIHEELCKDYRHRYEHALCEVDRGLLQSCSNSSSNVTVDMTSGALDYLVSRRALIDGPSSKNDHYISSSDVYGKPIRPALPPHP